MRCLCCNEALTDYESTLRNAQTGNFIDTCIECLHEINTMNPQMLVKTQKGSLLDFSYTPMFKDLTDD